MKPTYEPSDIESRWYSVWEQAGAFRPEINPDGEPFSHRHSAAERHRRAPHGSRPRHVDPGRHHPAQADAGLRRALAAGHRPCRHRHPERRRAGAGRRGPDPPRPRSRAVRRPGVGVEGSVRETASPSRCATLGFSTDWTRERFTLDEGLSRAVREVFVTLYDEGLIYRGNRIINWCPRCHTAHLRHRGGVRGRGRRAGPHPLSASSMATGHVDGVATTRPETMLGDTAVAVHPDDERYARRHRPHGAAAPGRTARSRSSPTTASTRVRHRRRQGHAGPRPARLRDRASVTASPAIKVIDTEAKITAGGRRVLRAWTASRPERRFATPLEQAGLPRRRSRTTTTRWATARAAARWSSRCSRCSGS